MNLRGCIAAAVIVATVAISGCSDSGSGATSTTTTKQPPTTSRATSTTRPLPDKFVPADQVPVRLGCPDAKETETAPSVDGAPTPTSTLECNARLKIMLFTSVDDVGAFVYAQDHYCAYLAVGDTWVIGSDSPELLPAAAEKLGGTYVETRGCRE